MEVVLRSVRKAHTGNKEKIFVTRVGTIYYNKKPLKSEINVKKHRLFTYI